MSDWAEAAPRNASLSVACRNQPRIRLSWETTGWELRHKKAQLRFDPKPRIGLLRAVPQVARLELMLYGWLLIAHVVIARGKQLLVFGVSHGKPSDPEAGAATCIWLVTGRSPAFSHSATLLRSAFCSPKRNEHRTHLWRRRCSPFLSFTSGGRRIGLTAAQRAVAIRVAKPGGRE